MTSSLLRLRNLRRLNTLFSKLEVTQPNGNFQRTFCMNCVLLSNITRQFVIHDFRESSQTAKNPDFGRVVELDQDFDELRVKEETEDTEDSDLVQLKVKKARGSTPNEKRQFKKREKKVKQTKKSAIDVHENDSEFSDEACDEDEFEKNSETPEKQNFKLSKKNVTDFRKIMVELKCRKRRYKKGEIILEGKRIIQDALAAGHKPLKVFFSRFDDLRIINLPEDVEVIQVPYQKINLWSDVVTSQGVIGVFKMPDLTKAKVKEDAIPLTVICDNIKDPGNLGTILRIVSAVGCHELFLTIGCVDIWESKVLRGGAGAHFRLPITNNMSWSELEDIIPVDSQVVLAENKIPENSSETSENEQASQIRSTVFKTCSESASSLPLSCYTSFEFDHSGAVIILGGETQGLSDEAYEFANKRNGSRVYLPMSNGIESLNTATALGILSYEFRRQMSNFAFESSPEDTVQNQESEAQNS